MNRTLAAIALAVTTGIGAIASAEAFDTGSRDWDGYGAFVSVISRRIASVSVVDRLDLATLSERDLLVLIEPAASLEVDAVATWVERGGRLLVIDESGGADALADRFGLVRTDVAVSSDWFLGNDALPRLRPVGRHPISQGIDHIVANHPSALRGPGLPVFASGAGAGVVWDTTLASGRAVFVTDASLFIGLMMPLAGNARLADNLANYLCASGCSATVVAPGGTLEGTPGRAAESLRSSLETLSQQLDELRQLRIDDRALRAGAVLLLSGAITLLLATLPRLPLVRRPAAPRAPGRAPRGEFEFGVSRYTGRLRERNFALPCATLADAFEAVFYRRLGVAPLPSDATRAAAQAVASRFVESHLTALGVSERRRRVAAVARTLIQVAGTPRGESVFTGAEPVDEAVFGELHREIRVILSEMGATDEYERRFARPQ